MSRKRTLADLVVEDAKVHMVRTLVRMPQREEAAKLLQKLVNHTRLLMRRKKWKVGLLCEFYPKNQRLLGLNVNKGYRIMIRLRCPSNPNCFLPYESLLGTMVHELVHIAISPHNSEFYQMVDDLTIEVQKDVFSPDYRELSMEMEFGKGHKLGGNTILQSRQEDLQSLVRQATIKRIQNDSGGVKEGRRLGGSSSSSNSNNNNQLSPRTLRLQAIERRLNLSTREVVIPPIKSYNRQEEEAEEHYHHQLSQEEMDLMIQNTQEIEIIDLIDSDSDDNYDGVKDRHSYPKDMVKKSSSKSQEINLLDSPIYCKPCYPLTSTTTTTTLSTQRLIPISSISSSGVTTSSSSSSASTAMSHWTCHTCLEVNLISNSSCNWCGNIPDKDQIPEKSNPERIEINLLDD